MVTKKAPPVDYEKRNGEIAVRLRFVRERLKFTQAQFGDRLGLPRERIASYEDCRANLPCDAGIKICWYYFVSEFWMAYGAVNEEAERAGWKADFGFDVGARLTMALATERIALTLPPGITFAEGFDLHLRSEYLKLVKIQGRFPRIVTLLPNGSVGYLENAVHCMLDFWEAGLGGDGLLDFIPALIDAGNSLYDARTAAGAAQNVGRK
jgi:hypothetical protein